MVSFSHQLSHLASARLTNRAGLYSATDIIDRLVCVKVLHFVLTANDVDVDIVEAAKNLMASIGSILSSTGAATLQATPRRKPRMSIQASRSNLREDKRRQTSVDVMALKQALDAKGAWHHHAVVTGMRYIPYS